MRTAVVVGTCLVSLSLFAACRNESTAPAATSNPVSSLTPVARVELAASGPSDGVPGDYWSVDLSLYDATGGELFNRPVTWASSDPSVAVIRTTLWNQASVQGQRAGIVTITATVEGRRASARIAVLPLPSRQAMLWSPSSGFTLIGVLPGAASSVATAINDAGQVVGYSDIAGRSHAFLWSAANGMVDLGMLTSGDTARATGINQKGDVVGWSTTRGGARHAFSWSAGTGMIDLGTLNGDGSTVANGINDGGAVVGMSAGHAFRWSPATGMVRLTAPYESAVSEALAINNDGAIVGRNSGVGVFWSADGTPREVGLCTFAMYGGPEDCSNVAAAINRDGRVAATEAGHVFAWTSNFGEEDVVAGLTVSSNRATGINAQGLVAGYAYLSDVRARSFVWTRGLGTTDLGLPAGRISIVALAINSGGRVAGYVQ